MGTYLSTPVTEKNVESGEALSSDIPLSWGVVDMQGWRKSMEDSHIAATDVEIPAESSTIDARVFAVFDGHGGPEVARFCSLYLISVLKQQPTWRTGRAPASPNERTNVAQALTSAFHAMDRLIDSQARREELVRLRAIKPVPGTRKDAENIPPPEETVSKKNEIIPDPKARESKLDENLHNGTEVTVSAAGAVTTCDETAHDSSGGSTEDQDADNDAEAVVEKEKAAHVDQTVVTAVEEVPANTEITGKVTTMFQRLLSLNNVASQAGVLMLGAETTDKSITAAPFRASLEQNGRLICNLPDHPIHAGATAIVAVIHGNTLTVANAGDSRAVLCRGGLAIPLSFDHKPMQERELARITKAGGFVNTFGRVNGNLNLSRSLGDLKYKQVPYISPAEQMITAEPDIIELELQADDEFLFLACDGIWDCLSNDQAVEYVRSRINDRNPVQIAIDMLDDIISVDPRVTQGIGGDNMTVMVVDLKPHTRSYRKTPASPAPQDDVL